MNSSVEKKWYPVATADELLFRNTYRGKLFGQELVIWKSDFGNVNIWENRCLHRGTRLSLGLNNGVELKCQYHGWRYSNGTGGCTYIPAHPVDSPANSLSCMTFQSVEKYGLIWTGISPEGPLPNLLETENVPVLPLRSLPINASALLVSTYLKNYKFHPNNEDDLSRVEFLTSEDEFRVSVTGTTSNSKVTITWFIQPTEQSSVIVRGLLIALPLQQDTLTTLKYHNTLLTKMRDIIESDANKPSNTGNGTSETITSIRKRQQITGVEQLIKVKVARKWKTSSDVVGLELKPIDHVFFPMFQPGAHIDVVLPIGLTRQYSLTNGPGETDHYRIGVKIEEDSSGGSKYIHNTLKEGDELVISRPRNNFPLRQDSPRTIFIAGGIGSTPLLSMAQTLKSQNLNYEFHYFARGQEYLAFPEVLKHLGENVKSYLGFTPQETELRICEILKNHAQGENLYICGPKPLLERARQIAEELTWSDDSIHFEYFKNTNVIDAKSVFEVDLARSMLTLKVLSGETILNVLNKNGINVPSSCQQGACGTCLIGVLSGEIDHQDVYLSENEKKKGKKIISCVSRAKSTKITLDI